MPASVLIVEDEFLISMDMEEVVRELGHVPVGIADTLPAAIDLAQKVGGIDVALVDVNLADGPTGPEIGRRLAQDYGIQVVFVTANPAQLGGGVAGTAGAIEKPVNVAQMDKVLAFLLGRSGVNPPPPPPSLTLWESSHAA